MFESFCNGRSMSRSRCPWTLIFPSSRSCCESVAKVPTQKCTETLQETIGHHNARSLQHAMVHDVVVLRSDIKKDIVQEKFVNVVAPSPGNVIPLGVKPALNGIARNRQFDLHLLQWKHHDARSMPLKHVSSFEDVPAHCRQGGSVPHSEK
eukprot:1483606-Amphidinium_carterae.1